MVAFGATAALAVALNRPAAVPAALTSTPPVPRCAASWLAVSLAHDAGGSGYPVDFTNTSRGTCALTGFPDVAAYGAGGPGYWEIGVPAREEATGKPRRVLLRPGATAHADVDVSATIPGAACRPVTVTGLRVIPPGGSQPWYLRARLTACSATGPRALGGLRVQAIEPGPGERTLAAGRPWGSRGRTSAGAQPGTVPA
jgi:hypothetical protein